MSPSPLAWVLRPRSMNMIAGRQLDKQRLGGWFFANPAAGAAPHDPTASRSRRFRRADGRGGSRAGGSGRARRRGRARADGGAVSHPARGGGAGDRRARAGRQVRAAVVGFAMEAGATVFAADLVTRAFTG